MKGKKWDFGLVVAKHNAIDRSKRLSMQHVFKR